MLRRRSCVGLKFSAIAGKNVQRPYRGVPADRARCWGGENTLDLKSTDAQHDPGGGWLQGGLGTPSDIRWDCGRHVGNIRPCNVLQNDSGHTQAGAVEVDLTSTMACHALSCGTGSNNIMDLGLVVCTDMEYHQSTACKFRFVVCAHFCKGGTFASAGYRGRCRVVETSPSSRPRINPQIRDPAFEIVSPFSFPLGWACCQAPISTLACGDCQMQGVAVVEMEAGQTHE